MEFHGEIQGGRAGLRRHMWLLSFSKVGEMVIVVR